MEEVIGFLSRFSWGWGLWGQVRSGLLVRFVLNYGNRTRFLSFGATKIQQPTKSTHECLTVKNMAQLHRLVAVGGW